MDRLARPVRIWLVKSRTFAERNHHFFIVLLTRLPTVFKLKLSKCGPGWALKEVPEKPEMLFLGMSQEIITEQSPAGFYGLLERFRELGILGFGVLTLNYKIIERRELWET